MILNKMRENNGFTLIETLIGLTIIAVLAVGAYAVWRRPVADETSTTPATPTQISTPTITRATKKQVPTVDPTAKWRGTYSNRSYDIAFRYPITFVAREFTPSITNQPKVILRLLHHKEDVTIDLSMAKTDQSVFEWIETRNYCPETFKSCTPLEEGPLPGSIQFESLSRHYASLDTFIKKGPYLYNFSMGVRLPNQTFSENQQVTYNQILSTFQFTD